ncbi:site-specific integrase [Nocardia puris]|uniref:tyrosine-type recombinase/integrase n=1 Tax=Nocardia TaxID=1817 RepID=UPI001893E95D|nr:MULTISPECIES: site-specific integrase [Nocardia]MBF6185034.1 site-specific integrase [Nocardia farcinica]MBF6363998.1 site-specific integrase [Nocardia farcinica]MBF6463208.1 site-specific integrase [Nocardia puris]
MNRRRSNGEGSVYRRKDGRWEGAAYLGTVNGKVRRLRVYGQTRAEAHTKLTRIIEEARQGILPPEKTWQVGEYLDFWLEREKRRPLTRKRHEGVVRLHIKPYLGHYRLDNLTVRTVQNFLDDLLANGRSAATIHQTRKVLSAALTYAMRQEMISRNVARLVELPRHRAKEAAHWTPDQTVQFLDAARDNPLYPAFVLLTLYGLRAGEVVGIRWCDVDFDHGVLRIRQQVQRIDGELRQVELKTESSRRDEPLLATAHDALLQHRARQAVARDAAGAAWQGAGDENELVFTTSTGRPLESHNLARSFMRICKRLDLPRVTLHGLRHSNATTQKSLDVHSRDIQAILGHGDVRTTGIYEHVDLASKRNALAKVEDRLFTAAVNRGRSRQNCRQAADLVVSANADSPPTKTPTPDGVGGFVGGSSQTRTGDTRLFRAIEATLQDRLTSINKAVRARERAWKFGCVAVTFAVKNPESQKASSPPNFWLWVPHHTAPAPNTKSFSAEPNTEVSDGPTKPAEPSPYQ